MPYKIVDGINKELLSMKFYKSFVLMISLFILVAVNTSIAAAYVDRDLNIEITNKSKTHGITVTGRPTCFEPTENCSCFSGTSKDCVLVNPPKQVSITIGSKSKNNMYYKSKVIYDTQSEMRSYLDIAKYNSNNRKQNLYCTITISTWGNIKKPKLLYCDPPCKCSGNKIKVSPPD